MARGDSCAGMNIRGVHHFDVGDGPTICVSTLFLENDSRASAAVRDIDFMSTLELGASADEEGNARRRLLSSCRWLFSHVKQCSLLDEAVLESERRFFRLRDRHSLKVCMAKPLVPFLSGCGDSCRPLLHPHRCVLACDPCPFKSH